MDYKNLKIYTDKMKEIADECVQRAIKGQHNGRYLLDIDSMSQEFGMKSIDQTLLMNMLSEREEVEVPCLYCGEIQFVIKPEYLNEEIKDNLFVPTPQEIKIQLAKHYLWLNDEYGGVQADFRNMFFDNYDFNGLELNSAIFSGSKFINCSFHDTQMCFAECIGTSFEGCYMEKVTAEEADFTDAEFIKCDMQNGIYTHSNFANAKFLKTNVTNMDFLNSCIVDVQWIDTDISKANMKNVSTFLSEWEEEPIATIKQEI